MKEIKEALIKHPSFIDSFNEKTRERFIFGDKMNVKKRYILYIPTNFFNEQLDYDTTDQCHFIQEYPHWFKELYQKVYNLYYEKNRLRILTTFGKKPYADIVLLHSLFVEDGATFLDQMLVEENELIVIDKKWESEIEKIKPLLEKEGYQLTFSYETEENNIYQLN